VEERKGGEGRDPTLKSMGMLMPASQFRCWRQNLKVVAKELKGSSKTKSNGAVPAHTRSEVNRKIGKDNDVAEIKKAQNLSVPWRAYRLYLQRGKAAVAAMYLPRVRAVGRAACACGTKPRRHCCAWHGIQAVARGTAALAHRTRQ
jgi:hypothetical protein